METQKFDFFFQKSLKFEFWLLTKSWNHLSFVNISPTLVIDTSMERSSRVLQHGNPDMWNFFKKFEIEFCPYIEFPYAEKKNRPGFVNISPDWYQSSNWYVNGKVFTSTTAWEPKVWFFFFKKVRNWIRLVFWLVPKSWNHSSRFQHAPICWHRGCIVVPLRVDILFWISFISVPVNELYIWMYVCKLIYIFIYIRKSILGEKLSYLKVVNM